MRNKEQFRQWFLDKFAGDDSVVGELLDAILDHAAKLEPGRRQFDYLSEMFENVSVSDIEIADTQFYSETDQEGTCPVCGNEITYTGPDVTDDSGGTYGWECRHCGATGREGYNRQFDRHYDVTDKDGNPIPGRPE